MKRFFILLLFIFFILSSCVHKSPTDYVSQKSTFTLSDIESNLTDLPQILYATSTPELEKFISLNDISVPIPSLPTEDLANLLNERLIEFINGIDLPYSVLSLDYYSYEDYNTKTYTFFLADAIDTFEENCLYFSYDTVLFEEKSIYSLIDKKSLKLFLKNNYNIDDSQIENLEVVNGGVNVYVSNHPYFIDENAFTFEKTFSVFHPQSYSPVIDTNQKYVALTFDDGPNPYTTIPLLKILKDNDVKATFFMVGYNLEEYPSVLKNVYSDGHDIGIHSYKHDNYGVMDFDDVIADIDKCSNLIFSTIGKKPYLVRPPYGNIKEDEIKTDDYFFVNWNVDPCDWNKTSAEEIAKEAIKYTKSGSIILLHDIYKSSYEAAEIIIKTLKANGYRFVTISEYFDLNGKKPDNKLHFFLEDYNVEKK